MNHLKNGAQSGPDGARVAAHLRAEQQNGGTDALAATFADVLTYFFNHGRFGTALANQFFVHKDQIIFYQPVDLIWIQWALSKAEIYG
jgi:hypothetical protein